MAGFCGTKKISRKSYDRKSYTRKNGVHVRHTHVIARCAASSPNTRICRAGVTARCIKDRGSPGKWAIVHHTRGIGKLRKGRLGAAGYSSKLSTTARRAALMKAIKMYGGATVVRMLNAIYVYSKRTAPRLAAIYKADRNFVSRKL